LKLNLDMELSEINRYDIKTTQNTRMETQPTPLITNVLDQIPKKYTKDMDYNTNIIDYKTEKKRMEKEEKKNLMSKFIK